jgi:hypothetical protein
MAWMSRRCRVPKSRHLVQLKAMNYVKGTSMDSRFFVHMDHVHKTSHPLRPLSPEPLRRRRAESVAALWTGWTNITSHSEVVHRALCRHWNGATVIMIRKRS